MKASLVLERLYIYCITRNETLKSKHYTECTVLDFSQSKLTDSDEHFYILETACMNAVLLPTSVSIPNAFFTFCQYCFHLLLK